MNYNNKITHFHLISIINKASKQLAGSVQLLGPIFLHCFLTEHNSSLTVPLNKRSAVTGSSGAPAAAAAAVIVTGHVL